MKNTGIPEGWVSMPFSKAVTRFQTKGGKLKTIDYWESGSLPVVDQGQKEIVAYTDKVESKFQGPYPIIVFGDHTRNVKLLNFEFSVGADGVVLLRPKDERSLDIRFLYYWLNYVPLHNLGYSRHFKLLKDKFISFPESIDEQHRIVARIEELTRRAEEVRRLRMAAAQEVSQMFQTEMNRIFLPQEMGYWDEYESRYVFDIVRGQVDPMDPPYRDLPHVAPDCIESGTGRLLLNRVKTPRELRLASGKYHFKTDQVLYSKIRPNLRKVALPSFEGTCSADMYSLIPNTGLVTREFLALALLSPPFTQYAVENSDRNAMPKINRSKLFAYKMKLPGKELQEEITARIREIQAKADEIHALQVQNEGDMAKFQTALLAKAFRGEL